MLKILMKAVMFASQTIQKLAQGQRLSGVSQEIVLTIRPKGIGKFPEINAKRPTKPTNSFPTLSCAKFRKFNKQLFIIY